MRYKEFASTDVISTSVIRDALETDGAVVVKGVFSPAEMAQARQVVLGHLTGKGSRLMLGKTQPNAAVAVQGLDFILSHPKIVDIYKKIYGPDNVVFTCHCDIHMNMISGWHKDSGEHVGGYFRGDYFKADDCKVYKVALYLQDVDGNDGLTVRLGSHRSASLTAGDEAKLATKSGDVVIFDVRLNHIGRVPDPVERMLKNASRVLNGGNRNKEDPFFITALARVYGKLAGRKERLSVFFTYGPKNNYTYDFSFTNMVRQKKQTTVQQADLTPELERTLEAQGVKPFNFDAYKSEYEKAGAG